MMRTEEVIAALGGTRKLALSLSLPPSTVQGWKSSGFVPTRRILEIIAAAARLDPPVHLRPDDFFDIPAAPPHAENAIPAEVTP